MCSLPARDSTSGNSAEDECERKAQTCLFANRLSLSELFDDIWLMLEDYAWLWIALSVLRKCVISGGGRNRIGRREKWPKKSWEEGEIWGKIRKKGEKET